MAVRGRVTHRFALIEDNAVKEIIRSLDNADRPGWLPMMESRPEIDPEHERLSPPIYTILPDRVEVTYNIIIRPVTEDEKRQQLRRIARKRWSVETSGIRWNTFPVHTDLVSQAKLSSAYTLATNGQWTIDDGWKFADGRFRILTTVQIIDLALTVSEHVRAAYRREGQLIEQIRTATTRDEMRWSW